MDLNIRRVDRESVKGLKSEALEGGVSLRELCIEKLGIKSAAGGLKNGVHGESVGEVDGSREASGSRVRSGVRAGTGKGRGTAVHGSVGKADVRGYDDRAVDDPGVAEVGSAPTCRACEGTLRLKNGKRVCCVIGCSMEGMV